MNVAVIGAGAYGSYTIDALIKKYPNIKITLFEVGNKNIKNENEIGYKSNIIGNHYTGLSKGRYFGFGGATTKWGGQLLTFSKNDFENPTPFMKGIIELNEKYKKQVFAKFGIENDFTENLISDKLFTKTGVWLSYFKRNLFNYFKISKRKNVEIISSVRVIKIIAEKGNRICKIIYKENNVEKEASFDSYFLTAGAFESNRILLNSGLIPKKEVSFSDHLSQRVFKIKSGTKIGGEDFAFRVKGTSLITKRIIGELNGISFFVNPIFNAEFPFFQNLKRILFKHEFSLDVIKGILMDLPSCIAFMWSLLIRKKIYAYRNEYYLYIDIENPIGANNICLADNKDMYCESALDVNFYIEEDVISIYQKAKVIVKEYLVRNNVNFEECDSQIKVEKIEDTYHPYGMMSDFNSVDDYFSQFENLLVVNTGVLPRAGGINTTASIFPLIEEYINKYMK